MENTVHDAPPVNRASAEGPLPPPGQQRRIDLHRRRAIISAERIDIRPSRSAIIPPLAGFVFGGVCVTLIVVGVTSDAIPYPLLALLLLCALLAVPLTGITLVYALVGANVIFDSVKQSGTWQQGFLGMGIGTTELTPFPKIAAILVAEAGEPSGTAGRRTEEFAQWEAVVLKESGKRQPIAGLTVPRRFARAGIGPVQELAAAVAALTGKELRVEPAVLAALAETASASAEPAAAPYWGTAAAGRNTSALPLSASRRAPQRRRRVRRP